MWEVMLYLSLNDWFVSFMFAVCNDHMHDDCIGSWYTYLTHFSSFYVPYLGDEMRVPLAIAGRKCWGLLQRQPRERGHAHDTHSRAMGTCIPDTSSVLGVSPHSAMKCACGLTVFKFPVFKFSGPKSLPNKSDAHRCFRSPLNTEVGKLTSHSKGESVTFISHPLINPWMTLRDDILLMSHQIFEMKIMRRKTERWYLTHT